MKKVYCKDCKKYEAMSLECTIEVDDYLSPNHEVSRRPWEVNEKGDCQDFVMKEGSGK